MTPEAALKKAIRLAGRKLRTASRKVLNEGLEYAADDMAEAYQIGAEEAQQTIVARLIALSEGRKI